MQNAFVLILLRMNRHLREQLPNFEICNHLLDLQKSYTMRNLLDSRYKHQYFLLFLGYNLHLLEKLKLQFLHFRVQPLQQPYNMF